MSRWNRYARTASLADLERNVSAWAKARKGVAPIHARLWWRWRMGWTLAQYAAWRRGGEGPHR